LDANGCKNTIQNKYDKMREIRFHWILPQAEFSVKDFGIPSLQTLLKEHGAENGCEARKFAGGSLIAIFQQAFELLTDLHRRNYICKYLLFFA